MSNIEWTDETWNPVVGCTRVSAGCDHCYAVGMTHRLGSMAEADRAAGRDPGRKVAYQGLTVLNNRGDRHFNGVVRCVEDALTVPLSWKKPRRVFVNSMGDLFHGGIYGAGQSDRMWMEGVFGSPGFSFLCDVWTTMRRCPQHTFQILTKRPRIMADLVPRVMAKLNLRKPLPNVWLGTSAEDQAALDARVPHLLNCPAAVRFLSLEPLLGGVDLSPWFYPDSCHKAAECGSEARFGRGAYADELSSAAGGRPFAECWCATERLHWIIVGGESGGSKERPARLCDVAWIRSVVRQCADAGVACFVKQLGSRPVASAEHTPGWVNDWLESLGDEKYSVEGSCGAMQYHLSLGDRKGGDPAEMPEDLRIRRWPGGEA